MSIMTVDLVLGSFNVCRYVPGLVRIPAGVGRLTVVDKVGSMVDRRSVFLC